MQKVTFEKAKEQIANQRLLLLYLSMPNCSVCVSVKPQIEKLFENSTVPLLHLDAFAYPEVAGTFQVLTAPVILVFFEGKEVHRQARFIDFTKLQTLVENYQTLDAPLNYSELFS